MRNCIICEQASQASQYCHIDGQDYLRCGNCGLVYIDRLLKTEELYRAYSGNALKSFRRKLMAPFRKLKHYGKFDEFSRRAEQIVSFSIGQVRSEGAQKNYLDIGCNRGFNLAAAHQHGWNVYGIELVPELIRPFINTYPQYRQNIFSERFEDARKKLNDNMFDLISGIDVVEHFEDVVKDMQGIYEILKPGGVVVFQTPDAGCERAMSEKCNWGALKPLEHLHLFNESNFETLARRTGFSDYSAHEQFEEADGNFVAVLRK